MNFPNWLVWIDKNLKWLFIPKLPLALIIIQVAGFFLVRYLPAYVEQLYLEPKAILEGQIWRIFTFIAIPLMNNFLVFFVLWFFYKVMDWLEKAWGSTLLTVYFLFAWLSTVLVSIFTVLASSLLEINIPTNFDNMKYIGCSFFFALVTLNPNKEVHLFFILPITFKWIAIFIAAVLFAVPLLLRSYEHLLYLSLLFANYLLFFGKGYWLYFKRELERRRRF